MTNRITERRLRSIIKVMIRESLKQDDLSSPEDLTYLSDMGINNLDDAIAYAMESDTIANENINRLMYRVIKESTNDDQKIMNAANLINNQIKKDSEKDIQAAASKLSELKSTKNFRERMKTVSSACILLGMSTLFAPLILLIIVNFGGVESGSIGLDAMNLLYSMGPIGVCLSMAIGGSLAQHGFDLSDIYG